MKPPLDIREVIPQIVSSTKDAGAFLNMSLLRAEDPEDESSDVTIHRVCIHGPDTMSVSIAAGRHIGMFHQKAEKLRKPLPASASIRLSMWPPLSKLPRRHWVSTS